MFSSLGSKDVTRPFVPELQIARIQPRAALKEMFLDVCWGVQSPTPVPAVGAHKQELSHLWIRHLCCQVPGLMQWAPQTSQHCSPAWIFPIKPALGFKAWFVCPDSLQYPGSICHTLYSKRQSNQAPCAKSQLSLLASHKAKLLQTKLHLQCSESGVLLGWVSGER